MPVQLVEKGRTVAREKLKCPSCGDKITIKYDAETKQVLWVHGASDPENGIIQCYECKAKLRWTPPEGDKN